MSRYLLMQRLLSLTEQTLCALTDMYTMDMCSILCCNNMTV